MHSASKPMYSKEQCIVLYIDIVVFFILAIYPSFYHLRGPVELLLLISPVAINYIVIFFLYRKTMGKKVGILIGLSIMALIIKALDGAITDFFWRFFTDTAVHLFAGCYMLQRKYSFIQVFIILFMPEILLFAPLINPANSAMKEAYPLLFTGFLALGFLYMYYRIQHKTAMIIISLTVTAFLSFVAYPNFFSYLNGKQIITKATAPDERINLPVLLENGEKTTIRNIGNKIVLLDVWYTGCGICFEKFPKLQQLSDNYKADSAVYIATLNLPLENEMTTNDAFDAVKKYSFHKLKSAAGITDNLWKIHQFPTVLIFDKQHRLRFSGNLETNNAVVVNNTNQIIEQLKAE